MQEMSAKDSRSSAVFGFGVFGESIFGTEFDFVGTLTLLKRDCALTFEKRPCTLTLLKRDCKLEMEVL
jgi:hypothetical protein